ncbi:MAG: hypothetical protein IKP10_01855 [Clostridia bacterium]|nr:hypothetical protein [Clostridia bacterium]
MSEDTLARCRALLADVTPLPGDCGELCGAACCASLPGEETGMLLFPGEEAMYVGRDGWRMIPTSSGTLLICPGRCARGERPVACMLFPLLPLVRGEEIRVAADARARAVCPLAASGPRGMRPGFVEAVRACGALLAADPDTRDALLRLTRAHDDLRLTRQRFGGG